MTKIILLGVFFASFFVHAQESQNIYIKVGEASAKKSLLAVPLFNHLGNPSQSRNYVSTGKRVNDIVADDLDVTGLFKIIEPAAYLEDTESVGLKPLSAAANGFNFEKWRPLSTEFLVRGGYQIIGNEIVLETYTYYVPKGETVFAKVYRGPLSAAEKIGHKFANDLVERLTGKRGIFTTKIVVSSDKLRRDTKEIFIMDWNGNNARAITTHKTISISPTWSPDGQTIAYTSFAFHRKTKRRNADLFLYNIATSSSRPLSFLTGINSGAAFDNDSKSLILTISNSGVPDLYRIRTTGGQAQRLTRGRAGAMSVEPSVSPDGSRILFSSDRGGRAAIYVMSSNGEMDGISARPVINIGKYNAAPSWSPDGKKLVFSGYIEGHFDIFTANIDGSNIKKITEARKHNGGWADNEDPSWSPDGRQILFASNRDGNRQLYRINADGTNERRVTRDNFNYFKPKWSPYLD